MGFYGSLFMVVSTAYDAGQEPDPSKSIVNFCAIGVFGGIAYMAARRAQRNRLDI